MDQQTDQTFHDPSDVTDVHREISEVTGPVSRARAERYYDRVRLAIRQYLDKKGPAAGKTGEYLLLVPDVFILLWRLINDGRVSAKNKVLLGSGLAYYLFPLDIVPEAILGPVALADDLVFGVYLLNKLLTDTDPQILREHWSGREDVLTTIRNVLGAADSLVGKDIFGRLKNIMR